MRAWLTALVLLAACGFPRPADLPGPGTDGSIPPADASLCFGSFVRVCFDSVANLPTQPLHFGDDGNNVVVNTDIALACDQHNDQKAIYCVITGAGLTFAQTTFFRAVGSKPLVLLSTAQVDVSGAIDLGFNGAGAAPAGQCSGATPALGNSGGAGGSFGGRGGNGGQVDAPVGSSTAAPRLVHFPATLRGGCGGEDGALLGGGGGPQGPGGGAVAIIAPSLALKGVINASGGLGLGGPGGAGGVGGGGGGGGSGGMIVLDVPATGIMLGPGGQLFANGGGGGEGGDSTSPGRPGRTPAAPTPAAAGGGNGGLGNIGNPDGGNGGAGSAGAEIDGDTSPGGVQGGDGGGGGGGGGAGFIHAPGIAGDSVISPPSLALP